MAKIIYGRRDYFLRDEHVAELRQRIFNTLAADEISQVQVGTDEGRVTLYISRGVSIAIVPDA